MWAAAARAIESERPDALFHDPSDDMVAEVEKLLAGAGAALIERRGEDASSGSTVATEHRE